MDYLNMMHFVYAMHRISRESARHLECPPSPEQAENEKKKETEGKRSGEVDHA